MDEYVKFFSECAEYYMSIAKNKFQRVHINRKIEHSKRVNKFWLK